ncbi:MAG: hypothetical protein QXK76_03305 [Candidatus Woesearchaeota archaeon]
MKSVLNKIFENNYLMAIISIILILLIVVISLSVSSNNINDTSGKAYVVSNENLINKNDIIKIEKNSDMIKIYKKTEPERYAYLRKD